MSVSVQSRLLSGIHLVYIYTHTHEKNMERSVGGKKPKASILDQDDWCGFEVWSGLPVTGSFCLE